MGDYTATELSRGFWQLNDQKGDAAYLIEGNDRALLVDTMMSDQPLMPWLRTLTDKPVVLALSHAHIDHMYRCEEFDTVYLHQKDIEDWKKGLGLSMWLGAPLFKVKRKRYPVGSFTPLDDDSVIDLGGMSIKCLRVSGHTAGSVMFIDDRHRAVICGDAVGSGTGVWMFLPMCTSIGVYKTALQNAEAELEPYKDYRYFGGHIGQDDAVLSLQTFSDMRTLCEKLLDKTAEIQVIKRIPAVPLLYATHGAAAILTRKTKVR